MNEQELHGHFFPEARAGGFSRIDGTVQFYQRIHALTNARSVVLDYGAGRGAGHRDDPVPYRRALRNFKGRVQEVIGADIDPVVKDNPSLDRALVLRPGGGLPLADGSVDVIVSDFTFEHFADPAPVAAEFDRVLAAGGWICARTPNRWGYIALANQITPARLRRRVLKFSQPHRLDEDVFASHYRLNSARALRRYFDTGRFEHHVYALDSEPGYHANSRLLYRVLLGIHALTPPALKSMLFVFLHKKGAAER